MKWHIALASLAFAAPSLAALSWVEAYDRVFAYMMYELDVAVWGPEKGYIAPKCMGSRADDSCTFDEFINYVSFGAATSEPSYYEFDGTYYLTPSSLYLVGDVMRGMVKAPGTQDWWELLIDDRKSQYGIWNDYGFVLDKAGSVAQQRDIPVARYFKNVQMALEAVSVARNAELSLKIQSALWSRLKDVDWQVVTKESGYVDYKWAEIEWDETVRKNPFIADPKSLTFKTATAQLQALHKENKVEMTTKNKVMDMAKICFGS